MTQCNLFPHQRRDAKIALQSPARRGLIGILAGLWRDKTVSSLRCPFTNFGQVRLELSKSRLPDVVDPVASRQSRGQERKQDKEGGGQGRVVAQGLAPSPCPQPGNLSLLAQRRDSVSSVHGSGRWLKRIRGIKSL